MMKTVMIASAMPVQMISVFATIVLIAIMVKIINFMTNPVVRILNHMNTKEKCMISIDISDFEKELTMLINSYSIENQSNTPDFLLAQFIIGCLNAYKVAVNNRDLWYGFNPWPNQMEGEPIE